MDAAQRRGSDHSPAGVTVMEFRRPAFDFGVVLAFGVSVLFQSASVAALLESSILLDVYTLDATTWKSHYETRVSILEPLGFRRPSGKLWYVAPAPHLPEPLDRPALRLIAAWMKAEQVPGLVLDRHPEITDLEIQELHSLNEMALLSLRQTHVTSASLKTLLRLKNLRYLGVSGTSIQENALQEFSHKFGHPIEALPATGLGEAPASAPATKSKSREQQTFDLGSHPMWTGLDHSVKNPARAAQATAEEQAALRSEYLGPTPDQGIPGHLKRGMYLADYGLRLKTLDGHAVSLSQYKGKVIFLNFWATWCGPCRSELPSLENLYQTLKTQDVFFGFVAPQRAATVSQFLHDHPTDMPVYVVDSAAAGPYTATGVPATFIISKKGDYAVRRLGAAKWDTQEVMQYLFRLMQEK